MMCLILHQTVNAAHEPEKVLYGQLIHLVGEANELVSFAAVRL